MRQISDKLQPLCRVGFTPEQSAVLVALMEHGPNTVAGIARVAHIHRAYVYQALPILLKEQLVKDVTAGEKQKKFQCVSTEELQRYVESNTRDFVSHLHVIPRKNLSETVSVPGIIPLQGKDGVMRVYEDIAKTFPKGGTFYRISVRPHELDLSPYMTEEYRRMRDKGTLQVVDILNPNQRIEPCHKQLECIYRVLPTAFDRCMNEPSAVFVYGNHVAFVDYLEEKAIIIENGSISQFVCELVKMVYQLLPVPQS